LGSTCLISAVRDEGPFLLEWVAHHLVLGFDRIVIASNDSSDGTHQLLDAMAKAGVITHFAHQVPAGKSPQTEAYKHLRATCGIDAAEWLMVLDVDEFLNVHTGDHSLRALLKATPDAADIITLNAANFGARGPGRWRAAPVTGQFLWRLPTAHLASCPVKSLTRNPARFREIHNHSLVGYTGQKRPLTYMRADGTLHDLDLEQPLWRQLRNFRPKDCRHDLAQYNHYAVKTYDTYLARRDRGRGAGIMGSTNDRHTDDYYRERAGGNIPDTTIIRYLPAVKARIADLLTDPAIAAWQQKCERRYRRKMREYWAMMESAGVSPHRPQG
jgi:hypothetical protein